MADELVERVVTADVFAQRDELTVGREQARRRGGRRSRRTPSARARSRSGQRREQPTRGDHRARRRPARSAARPRRASSCRTSRSSRWRRSGARRPSRSTGRRNRTVTTLYSCSPSPARQYATVSRSSDRRSTPSVRQKPTASSKSLPGVRIVTASGRGSWPGPCTRISIGSSVTSLSGRSCDPVAVERAHAHDGHRAASSGSAWLTSITLTRGSSMPSRAASAGVSTSANASGGATRAPRLLVGPRRARRRRAARAATGCRR